MSNHDTPPKPTAPEQPSPEGLDETICSASSTPEMDAAFRQLASESLTAWEERIRKTSRKIERERDRYKAAYDVAIYNLIGVAGYGHPGVSEATNIVDFPENV